MAFGNQIGRLNFVFSYDYFPTIKISESNIRMLKLQEVEVRNELTKATTELLWKKQYIDERFEQSASAAELL